MSNKLIEVDKVVTVWLDEANDFGVVEMKDSVLGVIFCPIERNESYMTAKYSIMDYQWFTNYQGARKNIKPYVTGRLSKRNHDVFTA